MERVRNIQPPAVPSPAAVVDAAAKYVPEPVKQRSAMLAKAVTDSYADLYERSEPYRARAASYHEKRPVTAIWAALTACSVGLVLGAFLLYLLASTFATVLFLLGMFLAIEAGVLAIGALFLWPALLIAVGVSAFAGVTLATGVAVRTVYVAARSIVQERILARPSNGRRVSFAGEASDTPIPAPAPATNGNVAANGAEPTPNEEELCAESKAAKKTKHQGKHHNHGQGHHGHHAAKGHADAHPKPEAVADMQA